MGAFGGNDEVEGCEDALAEDTMPIGTFGSRNL